MNRRKKEKKTKDGTSSDDPFGLWRHSIKSIVSSQKETFEANAEKTEISSAVVAVSLFHLERNMRWSGLELSSRHYCWTDMKNRDPASISDIVAYQICHNMVQFAQDSVVRLSDPSKTRILTQMKEFGQASSKQRCLFIYNGHGSPEPISKQGITLSPDESLGGDTVTGKQLIQSIKIPSCFIFDADYSGLLFDDFADKKLTEDRFAFFSCGPEETLPHRIGLPADLFTSCLLTPAYVALLWGSRQFYAFRTGGLHEFPLSYFSDENGVRPHLVSFTYEIERLLGTLVHAMGYSMLTPSQLYSCFYRDEKVGKLFVNFCLSRRIGAEIGFRPMSYPSIPDFSQHQLWEYFDLYLDRVLLRLTQMDASISVSQSMISGDFSSFLEDSLLAIEHILELKVFITVPNEISMFPLILTENSLFERGINALCKYIDVNQTTIMCSLCYGLMPIIMQMPFSQNKDLLLPIAYAAAKMQAFSLQSTLANDQVLKSFTCSTKELQPYLFACGEERNDMRYTLLALILMNIGFQFEYNDGANDLSPDIFNSVIRSIQTKKENKIVLFWGMLFIGQFFEIMPDPWQTAEMYNMIAPIEESFDAPEAEIRAAAIFAYTALNDFDNEEPVSIYDRMKKLEGKFINDPSILVRTQLMIFIHRFVESQAALDRGFADILALATSISTILATDPNPTICDISSSLVLSIAEMASGKTVSNAYLTSSILDNSILAFTSANYSKLHKNLYIVPPFSTKPETVPQQSQTLDPNETFAKELKFTEIDRFTHNKNITTDPVFLGADKVIFCDSEGDIVVRNVSTHKIEYDYPWNYFFSRIMRANHVNEIIPVSDSTIFLTTATGEVSLVKNIGEPLPKIIDSFSLVTSETSLLKRSPIIEYSTTDKLLFSSTRNGIIRPWSMINCNFLNEIKVSDLPIFDITSLNGESNKLAVGTDKFLFCDLRTKDVVTQEITFPYPVKTIQQYGKSGAVFSVLLQSGELQIVDVRSPDSGLTIDGQLFNDVLTSSWAQILLCNNQGTLTDPSVSSSSLSASLPFISSNYSILTIYDPAMTSYNLQQIMYSSTRIETFNGGSFHPTRHMFNIAFNKNIISTVGINSE